MARLTTRARKALPAAAFAVPAKAPGPGSFPIPDAAHARNALGRVKQFGTPTEQAAVTKKVHATFPGIGVKGLRAGVRP